MKNTTFTAAARKRELIKLLDKAIAAADGLHKSIDAFNHELRNAHKEEKLAA